MTWNTYSGGHGTNRASLIAVALVFGVAILNAVDLIIVRTLSQDIHAFEIVFFRGLFGLLCVAPWVLKNRSVLQTHHMGMHVARAGLKLLAMVAFIIAVAGAPIADVTTISFAAPIFVTIGAWWFLGEKPEIFRILAIAVGFVGILIVLQPGAEALSTALMFAVAGAALTAIFHLLLKKMSSQDSTGTLVVWNLIMTVILAAVPAWLYWSTPTASQLGLMALQGGMGAFNMAMMTKAMSLADASFIAPAEFLRLPVVAAFAYAVFGEIPSSQTWIGAAVIFSSTLLLAGSVTLWKR